MMSTYQPGTLCDDCLSYGLQNYLKPFYINLDEQIIKCESSRCMFPYHRKAKCISIPDSKSLDTILSLDEFIEESFKQIDSTPAAKVEPHESVSHKKDEEVPIMFDFSSVFMSSPVKTEEKVLSSISSHKSTVNAWKTEDVKATSFLKTETMPMSALLPPKARISRCLSDVKSSSFTKKSDSKISKSRRKNKPVLVIEPQSGKPMRPLDLIKYYMTAGPNNDDGNLKFKK